MNCEFSSLDFSFYALI